jgi:HAD superfamily hydrolase (TIGR01509 family)
MKGVRGIIYDCDGVLFDSRRANLAFYSHVLEHFGVPAVTEADPIKAHLCHTAASPVVFDRLLGGQLGHDALAFARTVDYRQFIPLLSIEDGVRRALPILAGKMPLALATNRGASVRELLGYFDLQGFFQVVVTCNDVPRPKPAPDMLLLAARRMKRAGEELLFVGDSELDHQAADHAGIRFAAYRGLVEGGVVVRDHWELVQMLGQG